MRRLLGSETLGVISTIAPDAGGSENVPDSIMLVTPPGVSPVAESVAETVQASSRDRMPLLNTGGTGGVFDSVHNNLDACETKNVNSRSVKVTFEVFTMLNDPFAALSSITVITNGAVL